MFEHPLSVFHYRLVAKASRSTLVPLDEVFFVPAGFTTIVCADVADKLAVLSATVRYPAVDE